MGRPTQVNPQARGRGRPGRPGRALTGTAMTNKRERILMRRTALAEARRHHRVRSHSKSGVKGVRYNAENDT